MRGLKGRVAVVTGGGSGIGREICKRLAEEGVAVGIVDINPAGGEETVSQIDAAGGKAVLALADITDFDAVTAAVDKIESEAGPIDILVNNAGWDEVVPFLKTDFDLWKKVVDINLYGPLYLQYAILPRMVERGHGKVVNISSDAGRVGSSGEAVYSAAKGGIIAFTKTMARELARSNIQLNVICPGPTDTPLFAKVAEGESGARYAEALTRAIPMRRLAQPDDLPGAVAFFVSDDANFITGQTLSVSGGLTMHG